MTDRNQLPQFDLMDAMEESVCFLTPDNNILFTNTQAESVLGVSSAEILERPFLDLFPEDVKGTIESVLVRSKMDGRVRVHTVMRSLSDGHDIPVLLRIIQYHDADFRNQGAYAIFLDLTELSHALREREDLRMKNSELEHLAVTCPLTGIFNRRYFELRFSEEVVRAKRYRHRMGLAFVDVDLFKRVNDEYGHQVGDLVLRNFAQILRDGVRSTDIVARYGGEEFVIVFPESHPEEIMPVCIRLRQRIQRTPFETPRGEVRVTASFGLYCTTVDAEDASPEEVIQRADECLYQAKAEGRNRIVLWGHPAGA